MSRVIKIPLNQSVKWKCHKDSVAVALGGSSGGIDADDDEDDSFVTFRQAQFPQLVLG